MLSRRNFLARTAGGTIFSIGVPLPGFWQRVAAAAAAGPDLPALVVLELNGGNDGLNTVVPYAADVYHQSRPTLRIPADKVLKLDDRVGLHPALKLLHRMWQEGRVKIVQNAGYPNPNRSHFRSMQIWHAGVLGAAPTAGWLGRAGDAHPSLGRCFVGDAAVPLAVQGRKEPGAVLTNLADYQSALDALAPPASATGSNSLLDQIDRRMRSTRDLAARLTKLRAQLPSAAPGSLEERLLTIRALLEDVPSLRIFYTTQGGFDTHAGQQFTHQELLQTVASALHHFLEELQQKRAGRPRCGAALLGVWPAITREWSTWYRPRNSGAALPDRQAGPRRARGPSPRLEGSGPRRSAVQDGLSRCLCHRAPPLAAGRSGADPGEARHFRTALLLNSETTLHFPLTS